MSSPKSQFDFQLTTDICDYMVSMVDSNNTNQTILEPTSILPTLANALKSKGNVIAISNFYTYQHTNKYDYIVMTPTMSPMAAGYKMLDDCMLLSDNIITFMPWLTIINGDKRARKIKEFGLKSITHMPRKTYAGSRIQTCIIEMERDYKGETVLKFF